MKNANDFSIRPTNNPNVFMLVDERTKLVVKFLPANEISAKGE